MEIKIKGLSENRLNDAIKIWNGIVAEGIAFPQTELLDIENGRSFFAEQTFTGIAIDEKDDVVGIYILHPNNVGRCGHICNASYAVADNMRGKHIGEALVRDSLARAAGFGFRIMQFNAVVSSNEAALSLYRKIGFSQLGVIPGGFLSDDGTYKDIIPHYYLL